MRFASPCPLAILISTKFSSAQDMSMGDVARAARAQKSQVPRATKVVTNEELGPQLGPVAETDDPAEVVNKASRALRADTAHTCRQEVSNNRGPGSFAESIREIAGLDRTHIVVNRRVLIAAFSLRWMCYRFLRRLMRYTLSVQERLPRGDQ